MVVAVTGASGQVGLALQEIQNADIRWHFLGRQDADITNLTLLKRTFANIKPDVVVNLAAYTAVDRAESEPESAYKINAEGAQNVAIACREIDAILIHISTDFVFDGYGNSPYTENDVANPLNVYGKSKLAGEQNISAEYSKHIILRSSWIYSDFGKNFYKTMLQLAGQGKTLRIVNDQYGSPTQALDLAEAISTIVRAAEKTFGIYHFANKGVTTWYEFATEIFKMHDLNPELIPISSAAFGAPAERPGYSVLSTDKIKSDYGIVPADWLESLHKRRRP